MRPISPDLLRRLEYNIQAACNNNQPQMELIVEKASKYINQGNILVGHTIRTGYSLGTLDICVRRESLYENPTEIVMIYIEDGLAKVATFPYVSSPDDEFKYKFTIGRATDVACDFDGRWHRVTDYSGVYMNMSTRWSLVTTGEPYYAFVQDGVLCVKRGYEATVYLMEFEHDVAQVEIIRGWKNATEATSDQGIICAYTKTDGKVYYRNFCEQADHTFVWENEHEITQISPPVSSLGLFVTNDYRTGIITEHNGDMKVMLTERSWSGMATEAEKISATISASVAYLDVKKSSGFAADEHLSSNANCSINYLYGISPIVISAYNPNNSPTDVLIETDHELFNLENNLMSFSLTDSTGLISVSAGINKIDKTHYQITFADFHNFMGATAISYSNGSIKGEADQLLSSFSFSFVPAGLIHDTIQPPVPLSSYNVES